MAGCTSGSKAKTETAVAAKTGAAQARPALAIPAQFADDAAKQKFAIDAVDKGYVTEVKQLLEESVTQHPTAEGYAALGTVRYNAKQYMQAVDAWMKAAELNPKMAGEMYNNAGNAYRDARKADDAIAAYKKAIGLDPSRTTTAVNLATLLKIQGKVNDAVAVLETAASANSQAQDVRDLLNSYKNAQN
jgi:Flp pilus assembly protein TadD